MQARDLDARRDAQRRVEIGQRFVEQENVGLAHDRAADRHALALAAGEIARIAASSGSSRSMRAASLTRRWRSAGATPVNLRPNVMFLRTFMCG